MPKAVTGTDIATPILGNRPMRDLAALSVAATISVNSALSAGSAAPCRASDAAARAVSPR